MTILDLPEITDEAPEIKLGTAGQVVTGAPQLNVDAAPTPEPEEEGDDRPPVNPTSAAASAFLAASAAGWMLGGTFVGTLPRVLGVLGALIGAGVIALSHRFRNPSVLQLLALPAGVLVGVLLMIPEAGGVALPTLVTQAIKGGGLSQPPAPFDPGWRFILVVFTCALATVAATSAVALNRARLAVFLPAPVVVAGVLLQPSGKELLSVGPSLVLFVAGLAVAFGGELSRDSETGARFEVRRLGKAGGLLVVIGGLVVGMSQLGFLYPPTPDSTVVPPKRPQTPPPITSDAPLFTVKTTTLTPLRLGVLDTYDGVAWLTPPYDPKRYLEVTGKPVPAFSPDRSSGFDAPQAVPAATVTATITIANPGPAREVPDLTGTVSVSGEPKGTQFDPRAETLRLPGHAKHGESYTVTAATPPDGAALSVAQPAPAAFDVFRKVPPAPPAVQALLDAAPKDASPYERLQFVRTKFFAAITATGAGNPVDVPPARVQAFLTGTAASPYEITASEVLLARWAGIPARIGYGYYNDEAKADSNGSFTIRPADGALWLEGYFPGSGWQPILGKPPKAQSSLDDQKKKNDKSILSNGEITAQLYIPIKQEGLALFYTLVQYWLERVAVVLGLAFFFAILLPGAIKLLRRIRRRRWANRHGPRARLAVAYAEIRDRAIDFNIGHPTLTPLEFLDVLEPDEEHTQLAWLVTRGLWGDLRRDLRDEDVTAAEDMTRSLTRRLVGGRAFLTRVLAVGSRVSLLDPWDATLPNPYWSRSLVSIAGGWLRSARGWLWSQVRRLPRPRLRLPRLGGSTAMIVALLMMLSGCVQQLDITPGIKGAAPLPTVPATVGKVTFEQTPVGDAQFRRYRDISLIAGYGLYVVRQDKVAVGTLQTATFKPGLRAENHKVREGVLTSLSGTPKVSKVGGQLFYTVTINDVRLVVWFPKDGQTYELLAATKDVADPTALFIQLIAAQEGKALSSVSSLQGAPAPDARRGAP